MRNQTKVLILASMLAMDGCVASQNDPSYGTVTVAFGDSLDDAGPWRQDQLDQLRSELTALNALGPSFVEAPEGSAAVVVRPFDSGDGCTKGVGRYTPGTAYAEIDPACTHGYDELRAAEAHEIMHYLTVTRWSWYGHICQHAGEASNCHPTITGLAILNPSISYSAENACEACSADTVAQTDPTTADLQLISTLAGR